MMATLFSFMELSSCSNFSSEAIFCTSLRRCSLNSTGTAAAFRYQSVQAQGQVRSGSWTTHPPPQATRSPWTLPWQHAWAPAPRRLPATWSQERHPQPSHLLPVSGTSGDGAGAEAGVRGRQVESGNPGERTRRRQGWARAKPDSSVPGSVKRREPQPMFGDLSKPRGSERRPPPATDIRLDLGHPGPLHRAGLTFWKLRTNPLLSRPPSAQNVPGLTRVSQRTLLSAAIFYRGSRAGSDAGSERDGGSWTSFRLGPAWRLFALYQSEGCADSFNSVLLFSNVASRDTQPVCLSSVVRFYFFWNFNTKKVYGYLSSEDVRLTSWES